MDCVNQHRYAYIIDEIFFGDRFDIFIVWVIFLLSNGAGLLVGMLGWIHAALVELLQSRICSCFDQIDRALPMHCSRSEPCLPQGCDADPWDSTSEFGESKYRVASVASGYVVRWQGLGQHCNYQPQARQQRGSEMDDDNPSRVGMCE
jgi:hypothetical protein